MRIPLKPHLVLSVDDSAASSIAEKEMREAGLTFETRYASQGVLPSVDTNFSVYEGLGDIRRYILPDPTWPAIRERLHERLAEAEIFISGRIAALTD